MATFFATSPSNSLELDFVSCKITEESKSRSRQRKNELMQSQLCSASVPSSAPYKFLLLSSVFPHSFVSESFYLCSWSTNHGAKFTLWVPSPPPPPPCPSAADCLSASERSVPVRRAELKHSFAERGRSGGPAAAVEKQRPADSGGQLQGAASQHSSEGDNAACWAGPRNQRQQELAEDGGEEQYAYRIYLFICFLLEEILKLLWILYLFIFVLL